MNYNLPADIDFGGTDYQNGYNDALALCRQIVAEPVGFKDTERLDYLERNPRLAEIHIDGKITDCYLYGVSGAMGLRLREIIDFCIAKELRT